MRDPELGSPCHHKGNLRTLSFTKPLKTLLVAGHLSPPLWLSFPVGDTEDVLMKPMSIYPPGQSHTGCWADKVTQILAAFFQGPLGNPLSVNPLNDLLKCGLQLRWGVPEVAPPLKTQQPPLQPNLFQQGRSALLGRSPYCSR